VDAPAATTLQQQAATAGLTEAEAQRRLEAAGGVREPPTSRSYASIVRANVFTLFNLILSVFGVLTLVFGDWRDALFLGTLLANTGIGIVQEVRAKRSLDRLALLVAPRAHAMRDGHPREVPAGEVVVGDLVTVQPGDQVLADGRVTDASDLHLDESILTGESDSVARAPGEELRSGAFVSEGSGAYEVTAVGDESYAGRIVGEARSFRHPRSPLEQAVNRLLLALVVLVVVLGGLLGYALWHRDADVSEAVSTATAGVVSLVPEGLVVLVSLTYAVASVRMARRGVLSQQLNAIESLASADVICTDKTGTLTESALRVAATVPAPGVDDLDRQLARYGASSSLRNGTLEAIADAHPGEAETVVAEVPFNSRRKWSAVQLEDVTLILGAPEHFDLGPLQAEADEQRSGGRRVVAFARLDGPLPSGEPGLHPPPGAEPIGLVILAEQLRPHIRETIAFFLEQDIEIKVLSGDNPETVAAIAADVGIPVRGTAQGPDLPDDPDALREKVLATTVIGRVSPDDKRRVVETLRDAGRYVAMVGDGVNDVPALKASRLAIAQGSGAQIAKSIADLVLVRGDFGAVPELVAQGRQALRNLQRVSRLYVTKSAFAAFLILVIGTTSTAYPLLPRHFTIAATLTIGIPTFFLALAPSSGPWRPDNFGRNVARFAVPAGALTGVGVVASYLFALHNLDYDVHESRTIATTVLIIVGLYLVVALEAFGSPLRRHIIDLMCAALLGVYALVLALPVTRDFFDLAVPTVGMIVTSVAGAALSIVGLYLSGIPDVPLKRQRSTD
jgi:cation-transporting P-type ATPase E